MINQRIPEGEVPEEIRLVNEFLNTVDLERFGEHAHKLEVEREAFRQPEELKNWLVERRLLGADEPVTEDERELAVAVRDALREAAWVNNHPLGTGGPEVEAGNRVLEELPLTLRRGSSGGLTLTPVGRGVRWALSRILADVAEAVSKGTWLRLKICDAEDCRWAYFDHSKSRTGRWCAMETCGNRHKTRSYRSRRKQAKL